MSNDVSYKTVLYLPFVLTRARQSDICYQLFALSTKQWVAEIDEVLGHTRFKCKSRLSIRREWACFAFLDGYGFAVSSNS